MKQILPGAGAALLLVLQPLAAQERPEYPADPAAHTVIVPFDASRPLQGQKAERYYLDYEAFQKLWNLAKDARTPKVEKPGGEDAVVNLAVHEVEVRDREVVVNSRLKAATQGEWRTILLDAALGGVAGTQWQLDGRTAPWSGGGVLVEKAGAHELAGSLSHPMPQGWEETTLKLPVATASVLKVVVPLTDGMPGLGESVLASMVSEEVRDGRRVFTFALAGTRELKIHREPARRAAAEALPAVAEIETYVVARPRIEEVNVLAKFRFPGAERREFTLELDGDLLPLRWEVPGLQSVVLRREGARQFAEIVLATPVRDEFQFKSDFSRAATVPSGTRTAPYVGARAGRLERSTGLRASPSMAVTPTPGAELERRADASGGSLGYWTMRGRAQLKYQVEPAATGVTGKVESVYQVGAEKLEILSAITLHGGRLPLHEAYVPLVAGFEVQSLTGPGVKSWLRDDKGIFIQFDPRGLDEVRVVVNVAQPRNVAGAGVAAVALPALYVEGVPGQKAVAYLATHAATDIRLGAAGAGKWREFDPTTSQSVFTVSSPWTVKRALRWESFDTKEAVLADLPTVSLLPQLPKFGMNAVLLAQATDSGLLLSQQVGVQVDQGVLKEVKLSLPATLPEARVRGAGVRDAQSKVAGERREYTVSFQGEVMTTAAVTLDWEVPLEGAPMLPLVKVEGASRSRRFFIVDNASSSEVKTTLQGVDETVSTNVPYLPVALGQAQYYQGRGDQAEVKLNFTRTEATAGNAAIVTLADITSALRPNGERWETVVYSLANRSLQFLPVRLPKGAELVSVTVGSERVRADLGERDGKPLYLIPLIQMRPGELSQQVRLTYLVHASNQKGLKGRTTLDDPELVGLSAERTLWNVWVPDKHDVGGFDGNMEPVVEEIYEDEKAQQKLSDATRLNRVAGSAGISQADAQEALANASQQLEELKVYQEKKKSSSYSSRKPAKGKGKDVMADEETAKAKSNREIETQLRQQGVVLDENRTKSPVFGTRSTSGATRQNEFDPPQIPQGRRGANEWAFNDLSGVGQVKAGSGGFGAPPPMDNTVLNDNIAVDNKFFADGAIKVQNLGDDAKPSAGKKVELQKGANLGRANAYNKDEPEQTMVINSGTIQAQPPQLPQSLTAAPSAMAQILPGDGRVTVPPQPMAPAGPDPFAPPINNRGIVLSQNAAIQLPGAPEAKVKEDASATSSPMGGQADKVAEVERHLQQGYSYYNIGDNDAAIRSFQDALRLDRYNSAARRGMERAEQRGSQYFDSARDHQRAKMLNALNSGWEDKVPSVLAAADPFAATLGAAQSAQQAPQQLKPAGRLSLPVDVPLSGTVYHFRKLKDHAKVEMNISRPWEPQRTAALWALGVGLLVLGGLEALLRRRKARA